MAPYVASRSNISAYGALRPSAQQICEHINLLAAATAQSLQCRVLSSQTRLPTRLIRKHEADKPSQNVQTRRDKDRRVVIAHVGGDDRCRKPADAIAGRSQATTSATMDAGDYLGRVAVKSSPHAGCHVSEPSTNHRFPEGYSHV